jgi:c-di-GMP-binding flagellar brake protein YcgR
MKDRRIARRFDLSLTVIVRPLIETESSSQVGTTRDISTQGVYFTVDSGLSVGAELDFTMTLPAKVSDATEVFIKATGKVVRVDKRSGNGDQSVGVAAVFELPEIVRNETAIA